MRRPLIEILYRDQVKRTDIFFRELEQRSFFERSSVEISSRHLVQIALQKSFAEIFTGILHSSFYREPVKETLHTIFYRDLHNGNLQTLTWYLFFHTMLSLLRSLLSC